MRILILGGSRFIGRRLAIEMATSGHAVTLFNRGQTVDGIVQPVERLRGDRRSPTDLKNAVAAREFDAAFDFVSYNEGDARLAVAALDGIVGHFIHISTCSVYWCTGDFPCPVAEEAFDQHGEFPERPGSIEYEYGYNKRKAEEVLFAAHRDSGFPVTIIRPPVVGGEGDLSLRLASCALRVSDGGPIVLPDGGLAPFRQVYVGDLTAALAAIAGRVALAGRAFNLAGDDVLSVRGITEGIAGLLERKIETIAIPSGVLAAAGVGTSFSPFTQSAAQVPAIYRARRELGWSPRPFTFWLERALQWGIDHCRRTGEIPQAYTHRDFELEVSRWYREVVLKMAAPAGTSFPPPE